MRQGVELMGST